MIHEVMKKNGGKWPGSEKFLELAQGIKMDAGVRQLPGTDLKIAFLTDPYGTYIELTENLAPPR